MTHNTSTQDSSAVIRTAEYALTPDTLYRLLVARTFGGQLRLFMVNGLIVIFIITTMAYTVFELSQTGSLVLLVVLVLLLAGVLGYPLWRYRQYVAAPANARLFEPVHLEIDAQFITVHHANGDVARTPLASITRALLTRDHWLIYVGALVQYVIPVSAFESPEDVAQFEQRLRDRRVLVQHTRRA